MCLLLVRKEFGGNVKVVYILKEIRKQNRLSERSQNNNECKQIDAEDFFQYITKYIN